MKNLVAEIVVVVKYMNMSEPVGVTSNIIGTDMCTAIVTLKTNVPIETPEGWEKVDPLTFTKVYTDNVTKTITIVGLNGLTGTAQVVVDGIAATPLVPNSGVGGDDCENIGTRGIGSPDTGRNLVLGMIVLGEVVFVGVGLAVFFKLRES